MPELSRREFVRRASGLLVLTPFGLEAWLRKVYGSGREYSTAFTPTEYRGISQRQWTHREVWRGATRDGFVVLGTREYQARFVCDRAPQAGYFTDFLK